MRYFPLFADLRDRRVLVVGGGEVAERKVRLLCEAGARVLVVARALTPWLDGQAADSAGVITHLAADYADEQLDGVVLAIAATDDRELNARVAAAARARNLLANVVDDAELSGFIVPAIVDRSPVVIAVSSGGTAPVLARLIRERLETAVDESIGPLAELLARWRARIRAAFPDLAARRRFYTKVVRGRVAELLRARRGVAAERELERSMTRRDRTDGGLRRAGRCRAGRSGAPDAERAACAAGRRCDPPRSTRGGRGACACAPRRDADLRRQGRRRAFGVARPEFTS